MAIEETQQIKDIQAAIRVLAKEIHYIKSIELRNIDDGVSRLTLVFALNDDPSVNVKNSVSIFWRFFGKNVNKMPEMEWKVE